MVIIPLLQLASAILLPLLILLGHSPIAVTVISIVGWLGLALAFFATIFAIALNRAWGDLKYLYVVPLWVPYSLLMDAVALWAIILEFSGAKAQWNKLDRTGVVSRSNKR